MKFSEKLSEEIKAVLDPYVKEKNELIKQLTEENELLKKRIDTFEAADKERMESYGNSKANY